MVVKKGCAIEVRDLQWRFGQQTVLDGVDLQIAKGKLYSIVGPNGSGKTTLLKNMVRLLETDKNRIFLNSSDIVGLSNRQLAQTVAVVSQNTMVELDFSALDMVVMGRNPYLSRFRRETKDDLLIAQRAMEMTDTWQFKDKPIDQLSGGEKQRVIVARAIAQQTEILLLDEPISHLDIRHQVELLTTISRLQEENELTVVTVLHDLNLAVEYSDYIVLIHEGKVLSVGRPEEVVTVEHVKQAYGIECCIIKNPISGKPHIIPITEDRGRGMTLIV